MLGKKKALCLVTSPITTTMRNGLIYKKSRLDNILPYIT